MRRTNEHRRLEQWVAREILPHEPLVRAWLTRVGVPREDSDDLIQEAYCRISEMDAFAHIERPPAFFFQIVRNLFRSQMRRARIVRIESALDVDLVALIDDAPSPEQIAGDRREYARLHAVLDRLPERCRRIFEMRKIEGLPQREIASRLGVSENVVENEGARGIRLVLEGLREQGDVLSDHYERGRSSRINQR